jgi:crotonobetainyl-CoA:carnitine CoA-transferase CaiB-like acyl-CoA transferase
MSRPLEGLRVVEVAMWAFVPAAAAALADMGAEVIKIEAPSGDPMRALRAQGKAPDAYGFVYMWEIFNRGKRSIALDLNVEASLTVLHNLLDRADVFITSLLPHTRRKLKIDVEDIRRSHPNVIYAIGSGQGAFGPDQDKGGYDVMSYWARSGIASSATPKDASYPTGQPGYAFGDGTSGLILAGGIAAAVAQRALTGKVSVVDVSLLASGMWAAQPSIVGSNLAGVDDLPKPGRTLVPNPLVNIYRTSDGRFVSLCMLQGQRYWPNFCEAIGRADLAADPRFASEEKRVENLAECITILDEVFSTRPLKEWQMALHRQEGQWDVVQRPGELPSDPQTLANGFVQDVDYGDGRSMKMVSTPVQFDHKPLPARPAPNLGSDSDTILAELGLTEEEIINLRIAGAVL